MPDSVIVAVTALAGVLLGGSLTRSSEYSRWLRSEQHRTAAKLLAYDRGLPLEEEIACGRRQSGCLEIQLRLVDGRSGSAVASDRREQTGSKLAPTRRRRACFPGHFEFGRGGRGPGIRARGLTVPKRRRGIAAGRLELAGTSALCWSVRWVVPGLLQSCCMDSVGCPSGALGYPPGGRGALTEPSGGRPPVRACRSEPDA